MLIRVKISIDNFKENIDILIELVYNAHLHFMTLYRVTLTVSHFCIKYVNGHVWLVNLIILFIKKKTN